MKDKPTIPKPAKAARSAPSAGARAEHQHHCKFDKLVAPEKLKPNPRNPRTHPKAEIEALARVISKTGWRRPICVSKRSGLIVRGHGALEAAKLLGCDVPVEFQAFKSEAEENAHLIADNRLAELAGWNDAELAKLLKELNADLDLTGFELVDIDRVLANMELEGAPDPPAELDKADELKRKWKTEPGQLWEIPSQTASGKMHRTLCGDSTDPKHVERLCAGGPLPTLCFTSPPYGNQRQYTDASKGNLSNWDTLMQGVFAAARLGDDAQILVNMGLVHQEGEWIPYWEKWIEWMRGQGWRRFGWYVWDQMCGLPGDWNGRCAPSHEFIFHFNKQAKKLAKWTKTKDAGKVNNRPVLRKVDGDLNYGLARTAKDRAVQHFKKQDSVWRIQRQLGGVPGHPAPFSIALAECAIRTWGDGLVYEPFGGSGTTIIACERVGRVGRAMEIEPKYVAVALERFAKMGLKPKLAKLGG